MTQFMDYLVANEQLSERSLAFTHAAGAAVGIAIAIAVVLLVWAP